MNGRSAQRRRTLLWTLAASCGLMFTAVRLIPAASGPGRGDAVTPPPLVSDAASQAGGPSQEGPKEGPPAEEGRPNSPTGRADAPADRGPQPGAPKAVVHSEGAPSPGLRVTLDGKGSKGDDLRFRWTQTAGPAVRIEHPDDAVATFTVPNGVGPLRFLLVVAGSNGSDTAEVTIPIESPTGEPSGEALRADAGDDQIALVGRQVTLNGLRSEPRGRVGFRWVQTGGPAVRFKIEDGYVFSFVPTVPGVYRFALVVACGSGISTPDEVSVTVGAGTRGTAGGGSSSGVEARSDADLPLQEVARSGLARIRGGQDVAEPLARIFEDTADRMDLYESYGEAYGEMSRRLEEYLPDDPARRALWVDRLFTPLSARILEAMRSEGLDLRLPDRQVAPLTTPQKAALAEQFRWIAEGLRSARGAR